MRARSSLEPCTADCFSRPSQCDVSLGCAGHIHIFFHPHRRYDCCLPHPLRDRIFQEDEHSFARPVSQIWNPTKKGALRIMGERFCLFLETSVDFDVHM